MRKGTGYVITEERSSAVTNTTQIWIGQAGEKYGPYSESDVRQWLSQGKFGPETMAWREGMPNWVPVAELFPDLEKSATPPPPAWLTPAPPLGPTEPPPSRQMSPDFIARPADAREAAGTRRSDLPAPPSLHWGLVLLFTVLTFGIFGMVWPFIQASWVRKIDPQSRARLLLGLAIAAFFVGYSMTVAGAASAGRGGDASSIGVLGVLLMLAYWVLFLTAYFSMAGSIRRKLGSRELPVAIGGITLFFFNMYYLQGQLRWLARWKETGQTTPAASKGVFWALWCIPFLVGILAAIAIPSYQHYLVRAQVSEGLTIAQAAETAVAEYYATNGSMPSDNAAAGLTQNDAMAGRYVSGVSVSDGKLFVSYDGPRTSALIRDQVLVLVPQRDAAGAVRWRCDPDETTIAARYLPPSCRR